MNGQNTFVLERELDCPKRKNKSGTGKGKEMVAIEYVYYMPGHE